MTPIEERDHLIRKIEQVEKDIEAFRQQGKADKQVEVLCEYLEYLQDELRMIRKEI